MDQYPGIGCIRSLGTAMAGVEGEGLGLLKHVGLTAMGAVLYDKDTLDAPLGTAASDRVVLHVVSANHSHRPSQMAPMVVVSADGHRLPTVPGIGSTRDPGFVQHAFLHPASLHGNESGGDYAIGSAVPFEISRSTMLVLCARRVDDGTLVHETRTFESLFSANGFADELLASNDSSVVAVINKYLLATFEARAPHSSPYYDNGSDGGDGRVSAEPLSKKGAEQTEWLLTAVPLVRRLLALCAEGPPPGLHFSEMHLTQVGILLHDAVLASREWSIYVDVSPFNGPFEKKGRSVQALAVMALISVVCHGLAVNGDDVNSLPENVLDGASIGNLWSFVKEVADGLPVVRRPSEGARMGSLSTYGARLEAFEEERGMMSMRATQFASMDNVKVVAKMAVALGSLSEAYSKTIDSTSRLRFPALLIGSEFDKGNSRCFDVKADPQVSPWDPDAEVSECGLSDYLGGSDSEPEPSAFISQLQQLWGLGVQLEKEVAQNGAVSPSSRSAFISAMAGIVDTVGDLPVRDLRPESTSSNGMGGRSGSAMSQFSSLADVGSDDVPRSAGVNACRVLSVCVTAAEPLVSRMTVIGGVELCLGLSRCEMQCDFSDQPAPMSQIFANEKHVLGSLAHGLNPHFFANSLDYSVIATGASKPFSGDLADLVITAASKRGATISGFLSRNRNWRLEMKSLGSGVITLTVKPVGDVLSVCVVTDALEAFEKFVSRFGEAKVAVMTSGPDKWEDHVDTDGFNVLKQAWFDPMGGVKFWFDGVGMSGTPYFEYAEGDDPTKDLPSFTPAGLSSLKGRFVATDPLVVVSKLAAGVDVSPLFDGLDAKKTLLDLDAFKHKAGAVAENLRGSSATSAVYGALKRTEWYESTHECTFTLYSNFTLKLDNLLMPGSQQGRIEGIEDGADPKMFDPFVHLVTKLSPAIMAAGTKVKLSKKRASPAGVP
jgi:hypothetical protein